MSDVHELLITQISGKSYAVQVSNIYEVINAVETTTFIDRPDAIVGLINLRGDIVPVHDLRHYTGGRTRELIASDHIVIMRDGDAKIGIAVDAIETVKTFQEEQLFAQSLSPTAFKILKVVDRKVRFADIRSIIAI